MFLALSDSVSMWLLIAAAIAVLCGIEMTGQWIERRRRRRALRQLHGIAERMNRS